MNKLFTTFLLMVFPFISYAQELNITIGPITETKDDIENVGQVKDKIYTIMTNDKGTEKSLIIYDQNLNLQKESQFYSKKVDGIGVINSKFDYFQSLFFKNSILHIFSTFETKSKSKLLLVQKSDLDGNFIGELKVIEEIKDTKKFISKFAVVCNEDSTMFAVLKFPDYKNTANQNISISTFKADLTKVNTKDIVLPHQDINAVYKDAFLSNDGDVFLAMYVELNKKDAVKNEDNDFYSIINTHIANNNPISEYQMKLNGKNMVNVFIKLNNNNNQIICTGFYSNINTTAKRTRDIDGFSIMTISTKDDSIIKQFSKDFPQQLIYQLLSRDLDKELKEDQGISDNYIFNGIYPKPDGSMMVTSEYFQVYSICHQYNQPCTDFYDRFNVLLINIDKNGEIQNFIDLPKEQTIVNNLKLRPTTSYITMQKGNEFVIVYNDHEDNQHRQITRGKDVQEMMDPEESIVTIVKINEKGEIKKEFFQVDKTLKVTPLPLFGMKIGEGKYAMPLYNKKRTGLIKYEIK